MKVHSFQCEGEEQRLIKPITGCIPGRLKGVCVCVYIFKVLIKLPLTAVSRKKKIVVTPD